MAESLGGYLGNSKLKRAGVEISFTQEQAIEMAKCAGDPVYFIKNYVKIVSLDHGVVPFVLWPFQERMVNEFHENRFCICKLARQSGKTTTTAAYMLWCVVFNPEYVVGILANKGQLARTILDRIKKSYEDLPLWMQQGITIWNRGNIELENGSKIFAHATSASGIRGESYNLIFMDELAHVQNNMVQDFFQSTYPVISSGKTTKIIIVSTPKGLNMFYKMWDDAEKGKSLYKPIDVHWSEVPGRDEKWKEETIRNTSAEQFQEEFECLDGNTLVEIYDKKMNTEFKIKIKDLYELLSLNS